MKPKTYHSFFVGVTGGPCPTCGAAGELVASWGTYGGKRVIVHGVTDADASSDAPPRVCTIETDDGWIRVDPSGRWHFEWLRAAVTDMT